MSWEHFIYFAIAAVLLWGVGAWAAWKNKTGMAYATTVFGLLVFFSFILSMWISLERPPLRTMGETRLWYSFFLPLAGLIVYSRWKYKWILSFSTVLALVFICVNLFKPEIHDKTLMPALQSPWFAPHVIVYMFAYAVLGAAAIMAIYLLFIKKSGIADQEFFAETSAKRLSTYGAQESGRAERKTNVLLMSACRVIISFIFHLGRRPLVQRDHHYLGRDAKAEGNDSPQSLGDEQLALARGVHPRVMLIR